MFCNKTIIDSFLSIYLCIPLCYTTTASRNLYRYHEPYLIILTISDHWCLQWNNILNLNYLRNFFLSSIRHVDFFFKFFFLYWRRFANTIQTFLLRVYWTMHVINKNALGIYHHLFYNIIDALTSIILLLSAWAVCSCSLTYTN